MVHVRKHSGYTHRSAAWARSAVLLALLIAPLTLGPASAASAELGPRPETGVLRVLVVDEETGQPLSGTTVRIRQVDRTGITDRDGIVVFEGLAGRSYNVTAQRLGYIDSEEQVAVESDGVATLEIALTSTPLDIAGIVVTGTGRERRAGDVYRPTTSMSGAELQRNLESSVPATLENVPGFAMQYNGPGAASPSIRGMSGDRVLMLEDGNRTGDLYQSGSDHGVMVEPLTAQRMEVVRGPATLLYGSNALGGVVNVIRDDVPRSLPSQVQGTVSSQFESVNDGAGGSVVLLAPAGPLALRGEVSGRNMGSTRTPAGPLDGTDMEAYNASAGASFVADWGYVGGAFRYYDNLYGVPGEFNGELIPGGHPGGVDIDTRRTSGRLRAAITEPLLGFFESVEMQANVTRYVHDEIEGTVGGEQVLGARFDQTTRDVSLLAHHDHTHHDHEGPEIRLEGALGLSYEHRDLWAGGTSPGTRSGEEGTLSAFVFEEFGWEPFRVQAGVRYDHRRTTPETTDSIVVRTRERRISKPVASRSFGSVSASLATLWEVSPEWTVGGSVARSVRNPAIEELFSDGPHLADFSFDIGSPDLDPEVGLGFDLFLRGTRPDLSVELAAFYNRVDGFINYLQTGETVRVIREGVAPRVTPVYEARSDDADFMGAEGRVQWEVLPRTVLDATASYTRAWRRADSDPLAFIPPLSGRVEVRYEGRTFTGSLGINGAAAQDRVPTPVRVGDSTVDPQETTAGYGLLNASVGWRHEGAFLNHSLTLQAKNLTDREAHDHLSRIKDIAPKPGRNLQLTYRVHF